MEKWSLGYALLKLYVRLAFWLSHKRIIVLGKKNIPNGKPVIFAPNHQNALMDPLSVACTSNAQIVWMARADIFKSRFISSILHFMKILPIFRIRDGIENLGKNEDIFNTAIKVLEQKKAIGLFPEAAHSGRRQMITHKKAVPRIAFLAEERNSYNLNSIVSPVGIYYSHYWHFNRTVIVNYGKPIKLSNYKESFERSEHQATMKLKHEIYSSLEKLTLDIKSKTNYENFELLRELIGNSFEKKKEYHKNKIANRFFSDKKLIELLEKKEKEKPEFFNQLHHQLNKYREQLQEYAIIDSDVFAGQDSILKKLAQTFFIVFLSPFLIAASIIFFLPFSIPRWYIQQKVLDHTFLSTFQFVVGLITHFIFFLAAPVIIFVFTKNIAIALLFVVASLLISKPGFYCFMLLKNILSFIKYRSLKLRYSEEIKELENLRADCINKANKLLFD